MKLQSSGQGIVMGQAKAEAAHLLIVRLNNWLPIGAAYGEGAAITAMERLRAAMVRRWGPAHGVRVERDEIEMLIRRPPLASFAATLASGLGVTSDGPLLSVSAGCGGGPGGLESLRRQARAGLAAAPHPHPASCHGSGSGLDGAAYRRDMVLAGVVARDLRSGRLQPVQRPVARLRDPAEHLCHGMTLCHPGQTGLGDAESYAALDRVGMAHRMDRRLFREALDALAADRQACLSVALSMRSLSLDLHGRDAGWDDLFAPLRADPDLGRRLIVEIRDQAGAPPLRDVRPFVAELRALGVRIAIGGFGAGQVSIEQWLSLSPDIVRLDRRFLHLASRSDADRARLRRLMTLARSLCGTLIVDGVDHGEDIRIALEERAEWIAGAILSPVAPAQPAFAYTQN
jgi:EAL domain-containing protein (putative c-di-GMP-specific phosphodiesterase class I)